MRGLVMVSCCLLVAGCATHQPAPLRRVSRPDPGEDGHFIASFPQATDPDLDPYDRILSMIVDHWNPPSRWQRWRRRDSAFARDWRRGDRQLEQDLRERGLWSIWDTGTENKLMVRIRANVPVWVFLQENPFDRESMRSALVVGFDEQRAVWWLCGLDADVEEWSQADFGRQWSYANRHWILILPPEEADWSLSPAELRYRGRYWMAKGEYELAAADFGAALAQQPDQAIFYIELADSHLLRHQYSAAEPLYRAALTLQGDNERALNNLAYLLIHADGDLEEALRLARRAVSLAPDNPRLLDTLGVGLHRAGEYREAVRILQRARARALFEDVQTQTTIALHLVAVYADLGDHHLARQTLADALALDPGLPVPAEFHRYLRPHS